MNRVHLVSRFATRHRPEVSVYSSGVPLMTQADDRKSDGGWWYHDSQVTRIAITVPENMVTSRILADGAFTMHAIFSGSHRRSYSAGKSTNLSFASLNVLQQPAGMEFKARRRLTPRLLKLIKPMTVRKWLIAFKRLSCIKYCVGWGAPFGNFVKGGSNGQV